jgi:O-antigen/teichoic acid export membrane protein
VASYSAGLRFADAAYLLALTAGQALLPSIAALASTDPARGARLTRRTALIALAAGAGVAMLTVPFGSTLTRIVFGGEYASAGPLMSVTMLGVPFMGMFWVSWFGLVAFDGERDVVKVTVGGALLSLAVGIAVIPGTGAVGAAWVYTGVLAAMALAALAAFSIRTRHPRARSVQPAVR